MGTAAGLDDFGEKKSLTPAMIQKWSHLTKRSHPAAHCIPCLYGIRRTIAKKRLPNISLLDDNFSHAQSVSSKAG
jgi:hypothetical protein